MQIVIVVHYLFPHITGTDVGAYEQAKRYVRLGHSVTMVSSNLHHSMPEETKDGVRIIRVWAANFLERVGIPYPLFSPALFTVLQREIKKADIVHVHGMLYMSSIVAIRFAKFYKKPVVLTQTAPDKYHFRPLQTSNIVLKMADAIKKIIINSLETLSIYIGKRNLALSDQITVLSQPLKKMLAALGIKEERIEYISNGVDTDFFYPVSAEQKAALRRKWNLPEHEPVILSIGRFVPKKGLDIFIGSADPDYRLVLVSRGNFNPYLKKARGKVTILEPMPQEQLREIYQACDIFVLAAAGEDVFSLVLMEAMACGLPVITSNDPFYRNYVDEASVSLVENTSENIRQTIKKILHDKNLYSQMSRYSRSIAQERFSWDSRIQAYVRIYNRLINEKK
ncbi:MAG: glycosyltransferase family 4 protein [Proteobacteria bacterium]|nr:glycosyltransferase family 4 protein [Pseudomonadota bacterium]